VTVTAVAWPSSHLGKIDLLAKGIRYAPPYFPFAGSETFLVTLTDARGATTTGPVTVTVRAAAPDGPGSMTSNPARLTALADGKVQVAFHGIPGRSYQIQRSLDLTNWQHLASVTADSAGNISHTDAAPARPSAYYRIGIP
jgi:hypothetical protein